jgi:hypothetical protein
MGDEVAAIVLLVLGIFRGIIQLLGPFQAFDPLYATFQSMVTNIWAFIRDNTSVPEDIEGPVFLVKRKTSIL